MSKGTEKRHQKNILTLNKTKWEKRKEKENYLKKLQAKMQGRKHFTN